MRALSAAITMILLFAVTALGEEDNAGSRSDGPVVRQLSVGIVVDNSGSYRLIFDRVLNSVRTVIQDLTPNDEAFLVTFVDSSKIALRREMTSDRQELLDSAENMFIEGGSTALLDAVVFASKYMGQQASAAEGRQRVLILITDGDEHQSSATLDDAVSAAKQAGVRILVLGLYDEKFYSKLPDRLVRDTGGAKFVPRSPKDTDSAVSGLLSAMRSK